MSSRYVEQEIRMIDGINPESVEVRITLENSIHSSPPTYSLTLHSSERGERGSKE